MRKIIHALLFCLLIIWTIAGGWWLYQNAPPPAPPEAASALHQLTQTGDPAQLKNTAQQLQHTLTVHENAQSDFRRHILIYCAGLILGSIALTIGFFYYFKLLDKRALTRTADLKKAYDDLAASQVRLVHAEKMATLGQMVAGVSHEINTPLGYVNNNLYILQELLKDYNHIVDEALLLNELLQDPHPDSSQINLSVQTLIHHVRTYSGRDQRKEADQIFADTLFGVKQISELIQNMKNFSRLDEERLRAVNINDCIDTALNIAKSNLKNIQIIPRYRDKELPAVHCSPAQINQVLLNLFNNAAQAADKPNAHIIIDTGCTNNAIHIDIIDNGKGIEKDKQAKIFEPFYTTKAAGEGTGLGLSICQKIINEHGGKIQLDSRVGKGSVFRINLPRESPARRIKNHT